ncbi:MULTISPECIES: hypothetical protein [unclassified Herbaspirillum]|uniref:hypothetical protein n=1 Tax=unclassified Herbaspirillum TaxID=2624150 RepID=UPI000E2FBC1E|nr:MULTISPECIES: hypothetical protein [unclassified Herbaspirillum]RFB73808.1 hypothetical protein DZB54_05910 [Herbaspirillum sp. 3R-3a1]TFI10381.1 hypothetical protein E4P32_02260 [Herbaspirillum sp. 3R11]TFI16286.1 hypothetical protein E4P31_02265 [Herbaspirillum sp. 3R-11]TFI21690.1 hypothetical protein E4P30_20325 [Herbaspirillum sp. 3C11]
MTLEAIGAMLKTVPAWCWKLLLVCAALLAVEWHGRHAIQVKWDAADEARAELAREVGRAQKVVVAETQIKYRDLIQRIYVQGEENEGRVQEFVTGDDSKRFGVNVGFVRMHDAAWSGADAGPADSADRGPAAIPLADVAAADVHNATSCRAWREIALGLRENYRKLQEAAAAAASSK